MHINVQIRIRCGEFCSPPFGARSAQTCDCCGPAGGTHRRSAAQCSSSPQCRSVALLRPAGTRRFPEDAVPERPLPSAGTDETRCTLCCAGVISGESTDGRPARRRPVRRLPPIPAVKPVTGAIAQAVAPTEHAYSISLFDGARCCSALESKHAQKAPQARAFGGHPRKA